MKQAIVHLEYHSIEGILIEDHLDFLEYCKFAEKEIELGIRAVFNSSEPMERWDHICRDPSTFSAMFSLSFTKAKMEGGNPLLKLDDVINQKYRAMINCLLKGQSILVNKVGGWFPFGKEVNMIRIEPFEYKPELHYYIPKKSKDKQTKYINIENDPELEEYTYKHLRKLDPNFSNIRNAIHWRREDFLKVLKEFKQQGGKGLWIYTTGLDVDQMYRYTQAAIDVGIDEFIFIFKGEETQELFDFATFLRNNEKVKSYITDYEENMEYYK